MRPTKSKIRYHSLFFAIILCVAVPVFACDSIADREHASPSLQKFMDKGMLVHVGSLCIDETKNEVSVKGYKPVTYWSLNRYVPNNQFFSKHGKASCIVLTPLSKHINALTSICAQEVICLGDCVLGPGDIVLFQQDCWLDVYNQKIDDDCETQLKGLKEKHSKERENNVKILKDCIKNKESLLPSEESSLSQLLTNNISSWKSLLVQMDDRFNKEIEDCKTSFSYGKVSSQFNHGHRQYYSQQERELLTKLGIEVISDLKCEGLSSFVPQNAEAVLSKVLTSKGRWSVQFDGMFWTHKSPFVVDGVKITNQKRFFDSLLQAYPRLSFGYEFYSQTGYASLFRILFDDFSGYESFYSKYPEHFSTLWSFLNKTLVTYIQEFPLENSRKSGVVQKLQDLKMKPEEEDDDESEKSLDFSLLSVILPLSSEIFKTLDLSIASDALFHEAWPAIKTAYQFTEHHRQSIASSFQIKGSEIYKTLSPDAAELVYIAATGHDFISRDGQEVPGSPELPEFAPEEELKKINTARSDYFKSYLSQWFSAN